MGEAPFGLLDYVKYPFLPGFEQLLKMAPALDAPEAARLLGPARVRLQGARANRPLEYPEAEARPEDWGLSFYIAALAIRAVGSAALLRRYARVEAARVRRAFEGDLSSRPYRQTMLQVVNGLFRLDLLQEDDRISCGVANYLKALAAMPSIPPNLKLVNRPVSSGRVRLTEAELVELVKGRWYGYILSRLMAMPRPGPLPDPLRPLYEEARTMAEELEAGRAAVKPGGYDYIEKLLERPVTDGRHRLVWLVLTPYLVNIKGLDVEEAVAHTVDYLRRTGWSEPRLQALARYHAERAKRIGLRPPKLSTIRAKDPQLYAIISGALGLREAS
ncbi:MAG: DNA primase noncatalytic subunit PriX [Nitrososphaerota archaeon]